MVTERRARGALARVLVVDDEADILELVDLTLSRMGLAAVCAGTLAEAREALAAGEAFQLCLTDMRLPDGEGLDLVRHIARQHPELPVAVITAFGTAENAVAALKAGAFDYLAKPVGLEHLRSLVKAALRLPDNVPENTPSALGGQSAAMQQVAQMISKLARSQAPVYVSGESGSGKEVAARRIHAQGARAGGPFIPVNCGAIPENLMESEFFGHRKGAFTGAGEEREGFFQAANGGTLFLDEIADLPLSMQVKLLRAIQEKRVRKVGSTQEEPVDIRVICATHRNLAACVEAGTFRQDLYYRLNVIELRMPPLRERGEDIPGLVQQILDRIAASSAPALAPAALAALRAYHFPGNVRELENILERATALCADGMIGVDDLQLSAPPLPEGEGRGEETLEQYLDRLERQALQAALEKTGGNRTAAARLLGLSFRSMRYRLERLGID